VAANFISDGSKIPATPLKAPQLARTWRFGQYEIARFPRQGRWAISRQGEMTPDAEGRPVLTGRTFGVAGCRTLIGALIATRRLARTPMVTNVTVNVAGSVTAEQDLVRAVAKGLRGYGGQGPRQTA
jgi:hypothetical protein